MSRLVLAGGGHAHLFVLEALARRRPTALDVTLVSLGAQQAYSGMVPGLIGGRYEIGELSFDLAAMSRRAGVTFLVGEVVRIEPDRRRITLSDGRALPYDVLSVATGSAVEGENLPGVAEHAVRVKPISRAVEVVSGLERIARQRDDPRVVVVGGGAAGVELALNTRARLMALDRPRAGVTLVESEPRLLGGRFAAAERVVRRALGAHGVALQLGYRVASVLADAVRFEAGEPLSADMVVWATGAAPSHLLRASGLPLSGRGFLLVNDRLQSTGDSAVFAAGDVASPAAHPTTPKAGVYAVRQGPVLARNLLSAAQGGRADATYRPQPRFLALLNTGDGRAIVWYDRWAVWSSWGMRLKNHIDRGFMRRFQRLEGTNAG
ncbi:MAG TPA: FAD-dependent oxidoreductase [Gemmatimonadales bacterium]|nr:FAD-dependent oxidoreductase [Gemmatimonadales bacterium]